MDYLDAVRKFDQKEYIPIYVFYGEEKYLFESMLQKVEKLTSGGFGDFNLTIFSGNSYTMDEVVDSCETLPVGSDHKFVVVRETTFFTKTSGLDENDIERLSAYVKSPNPTTVLLFEANGFERTTKLYKSISHLDCFIELAKVDGAMFGKWVAKQFKENGKIIDKDTLKQFVASVGYNLKDSNKTLVEIKNEIDKICAKTLDKSVKSEDFEEMTENALFKSVFDMVDSIGIRNSELSVRIYKDLISKGKEPREIFPLIVRHFRILKRIKNVMENGSGNSVMDMVFKSFKLPGFTHRKYKEQTNYFDEKMIDRIIEYCLMVDYNSKKQYTDFERELETLIIKLCKISGI